LGEENGVGQFGEMGWARSAVEHRLVRRKRPTIPFPIINSFSKLKNQQERNKIGKILRDLRKIQSFAWR
jgi:hypothetical protein